MFSLFGDKLELWLPHRLPTCRNHHLGQEEYIDREDQTNPTHEGTISEARYSSNGEGNISAPCSLCAQGHIFGLHASIHHFLVENLLTLF